jgi:hypothetical protein
MSRTLIGIDIGWSTKRASCGVAVRGGNLLLPYAHTYGTRMQAGRYTLPVLLEVIGSWRSRNAQALKDAIVVLDGPLGPAGRPTRDRHVDSACSREEFYQRCQPVPISHPQSAAYIDATYRIFEALGMEGSVWMGGAVPAVRAVVAETNPTVALALLVEPQPRDTLPSRRRARLVNGRLVRAKSDWYWACGANVAVARVLGTQEVAKEKDHERVAALLCLAVASEIEAGRAVALGDKDGIYAVPHRLAEGWRSTLQQVGGQGTALYEHMPERAGMGRCLSVEVEVLAAPVPGCEEEPELGKGDLVELVIADSGGLNETQNPWLEGMESPVQLLTCTPKPIHLSVRHGPGRLKNVTQWVVTPTASVLRELLAHYCPAHDRRRHLSKHNAVVVVAKLV